ncbi:MAG: hypothetical protein ACOYKZ_06845 [Chlamydiia bacterium]
MVRRLLVLLSASILCGMPVRPALCAAVPKDSKPTSQAKPASPPSGATASSGKAVTPATSVIHGGAAMATSGTAEIVDTLPEDIAQELRQEAAAEPTVSSGGNPERGHQPCVYAPQCGKRQAIGYAMMAWGAILIGVIGLAVWLGLPGDTDHCHADSDCGCCN